MVSHIHTNIPHGDERMGGVTRWMFVGLGQRSGPARTGAPVELSDVLAEVRDQST